MSVGVHRFTSFSTNVRVHAGDDALDALLPEMRRLGATRVFVICGRSVASKTTLLQRMRAILGECYAGEFTHIKKDAPLADVIDAAQGARDQRADLLIAVGAGSVLKAVRVVAIALGEEGALDQHATQYRNGGTAESPRLTQPKIPIFAVLTAATSAQNRGGAALKRDDGGPRLEFYDPKTRPRAIFWDSEALRSAPASLALSTGVGVYWRALMSAGAIEQANPLVQASRIHAFRLARDALGRLTDPHDTQARIDMCAAALLQNRDEEDGGRPFDVHWVARAVYALGAGLFNRVPHLDQGATHAVLTVPAIECFADLCPDAVVEMGMALGLARNNASVSNVIHAVQDVFARVGLQTRLEGVSAEDGNQALASAMFNFNADRTGQLRTHHDRLRAILQKVTS